MTEKRCCTCGLSRPLTDFNRRAAARDGPQSRCRACSREWYGANKEKHSANVRRRNARVRAEHQVRIAEHLLTHPCVDCGERDVLVLDFDHEDPSHTTADVTRLVAMALPWPRVLSEIEKCSVRCANCHRRRTTQAGGFWRAAFEADRRSQEHARATARLTAVLR